MLAVFALLLPVATVAAPLTERASLSGLSGILSWKKRLTFDRDGKFKVLSLSDMHFGERWGNTSWASWGPENDAETQRVHGAILDNERPSYVVFNGDLTTGENLFAENATNYLDLCFEPTAQRGIPFSSTHGNHDNANNINHQQAIEYEQANYRDLSYTRMDVGPKPWGVGNYWVPVYEHWYSWRPSLIMWFFDSRAFNSGTGAGPGPVPEGAGDNWVEENSVPAYIRRQAKLMKLLFGQVPPSLAFVHIPFQNIQFMRDLPTEGSKDDGPQYSVQGRVDDELNGLDQKTFDALVEISGKDNKVMAITSGHHHGENWCGRSDASDGLSICWNGHSGYGGYVTENTAVRNGRVFDVDLKAIKQRYPSVRTYNAYEDGSIAEDIILSRDYLADPVDDETVRRDLIWEVQYRQLPPKPDYNMWAITEQEWERLVMLERIWWRDHDAHFAIFQDSKAAVEFAHAQVISQDR